MLGGPLLLAAPALGAAQQALRSWTAWAAASRAGTAGPAGSVAEALTRSSAEIQAAALLLERAALRADTEDPAPAVIAENRRNAAFAADLLVTAVERLFRTGGAHVRDDTGLLQRCWRDVHTVAAHGALRLDAAATAYATATLDQGTSGAARPVGREPQ
jgi:hypothetical protein